MCTEWWKFGDDKNAEKKENFVCCKKKKSLCYVVDCSISCYDFHCGRGNFVAKLKTLDKNLAKPASFPSHALDSQNECHLVPFFNIAQALFEDLKASWKKHQKRISFE